MKATGIIRRVDDLGRIVIPKEIRHKLNVREGSPMEMYLDGNKLVIERYKTFDSIAETVDTLQTLIADYSEEFKEDNLSLLRNQIEELKKAIEEASIN